MVKSIGSMRWRTGLLPLYGADSIGFMPTIFRLGPYRFFFYAGDRDEPAHVHVERDEAQAKFWLAPIRLARSRGFGRKELNRIRKVIEQNQARLIESWNEFFIG